MCVRACVCVCARARLRVYALRIVSVYGEDFALYKYFLFIIIINIVRPLE